MDKDNKWYRLGLYEKSMPNSLSIEEKLKIAKKCGYDYLELSIDESDEKLARLDYSFEERQKLNEVMAKLDFRIGSICLSGHRKYPLGLKETQNRSLEIMEKAIKLAYDLGIRIIQLAGYDTYYTESNDETKSLFKENLSKCVDMASKYGVLLGFETMETPFMDTVKKSMVYVNEINSPYLKVYPDIGNLTNASLIYKEDVTLDIESGKGDIIACHIKETIPGHYREIPFGEGHVEFKRVLKTMKDLNVRIYTLEFWDNKEDDFESIITFNKNFADNILKNL